MSVVKIEGGVVVQTWHDVKTVEDAVTKYGLDPSTLVEADHPSGMLFDGDAFTLPPLPPAVPPSTVTQLQLVRAMRAAGLWSQFKSNLKQSPSEIKEDWEYASTLYRNDTLVLTFGEGLGLDTAAIDALFVEAATL